MVKKKIYLLMLILLTIVFTACNTKDEEIDYTIKEISKNDVIKTFEDEGIKLQSSNIENKDSYIFNEVKPSIYKLQNGEGLLFVYVFKSLQDRIKAERNIDYEIIYKGCYKGAGIDWRWGFFFFEEKYRAKNTLILYFPKPLRAEDINNMDELNKIAKTTQEVHNIVFDKLNPTEELVFKGESENWEAEYKIKYYSYFMKDENKRIDYQSASKESGVLIYKGDEIPYNDIISYKIEKANGSMSRTGARLDENKTVKINDGSSPYDIDNIITVTISWKDKDETLKLTAEE